MVVDTSAVVAVIEGEPDRPAFIGALTAAETVLLSAGSYLECVMVLTGKEREAEAELREFLARFGITVVEVSFEHARAAADGFLRYGKGRHPAGLNYGDCFAYALAKATGEPLLFKGKDFALTDATSAL